MQETTQISEWIKHINQTSHELNSGKLLASDKFGKEIILEWTKADILSCDLAAFKKNISETASQILAPIEAQFLKSNPDAVSQELFLKPCAPFFEKGPESVDWNLVKDKIQANIKQFYLADISAFGPQVIKPLLNDIYYFATVKHNDSPKILGFIMVAITPNLAYGDVKIINLVIVPDEQEKGLERLLIDLIFKIIPEAKKLFMFIRPTNSYAIKTYGSLGFRCNENPPQDPNHKFNAQYLEFWEYKK